MNLYIYPLLSLISFLNCKNFYIRFIVSYIPLLFLGYLSQYNYFGVLNYTLFIPMLLLVQKLNKTKISRKIEYIYFFIFMILKINLIAQDYITYFVTLILLALLQDFLPTKRTRNDYGGIKKILIIYMLLLLIVVFNKFNLSIYGNIFQSITQILFVISNLLILVTYTCGIKAQEKFKTLPIGGQWIYLAINFLILPMLISNFLPKVLDSWFWSHNKVFLCLLIVLLCSYYTIYWYMAEFKIKSFTFMSYHIVSFSLLNIITNFTLNSYIQVIYFLLFGLNVLIQYGTKWKALDNILSVCLFTLPLTPLFIMKYIFIDEIRNWGYMQVYLVILFSLLPLVFIKKFKEMNYSYAI